MVTLSTPTAVLSAVERARDVTFAAYLLPDGAMREALEAAARAGATVHVRLESQPYGDGARDIADENKEAIKELRHARIDARSTLAGENWLHLKAVVCDGVAYLDDRNFAAHGAQTVVCDDSKGDAEKVLDAILRDDTGSSLRFSTSKWDGLKKEAALIREAHRGDTVEVASEFFSGCAVSVALRAAAHRGVHCKLEVGDQKHRKPQAITMLRNLAADGVEIRIGKTAEKFAVLDRCRAWIGSANATYGWETERDWSIRTSNEDIARAVHRNFVDVWREGKAVRPSAKTIAARFAS
ncbi:MAG: phospholipase D family protein [Candidatus Eremiobacteraeota bacterium]|nr:phospholipase D family protein [Candidatus Eremiobacteraeota bacterium]